jgi:hypothetical protein
MFVSQEYHIVNSLMKGIEAVPIRRQGEEERTKPKERQVKGGAENPHPRNPRGWGTLKSKPVGKGWPTRQSFEKRCATCLVHPRTWRVNPKLWKFETYKFILAFTSISGKLLKKVDSDLLSLIFVR